MNKYPHLLTLGALACLSSLSHSAVLFTSSGGYLTGITLTAPLSFTVADGSSSTIGTNGYKLVFQDAYTGLGGSEFTGASGPTISVNAERVGGLTQDWDFETSQVQRGFSGGDIDGPDLHVRFVINNVSDFNATLFTTINIPSSPIVTLDSLTTLEEVNNVSPGGQVNVFIATAAGDQITNVMAVDVIPEPSSTVMLGLGLAAVTLRRKR
ncbi:PEP-CTERM sorting domain-containing protein [Rubritalea marina]|uniref:PEP-CTERM sorting domain-containing protein n=1 Tax=Rubritalea marina TaxID=361055 RepID=UPI00036772BA|nr:PEP-CTERM sorting domain-containing protein [Rubritalea marina]